MKTKKNKSAVLQGKALSAVEQNVVKGGYDPWAENP